MTNNRRVILALVGLFALAAFGCGRRSTRSGEKDKGAVVMTLSPMSLLSQSAFPEDLVALKVAAFKTRENVQEDADVVPAAGEVITWSLVGSIIPDGASLDSETTLTDDNGIAVVYVEVGTEEDIPFGVQASLAGAEPVTFQIYVSEVEQDLISLSPDDPIETVLHRTERLRVRLSRHVVGETGGIPISNAEVRAVLVGGAVNGSYVETTGHYDVTVSTDISGIATFRFFTGDAVAEYAVEFSYPGAETLELGVRVEEQNETSGCQVAADCPAGFVCMGGECTDTVVYCSEDAPCPSGYECSDLRTCEVAVPESCDVEADCDEGEICHNGWCIPEDGCLSDNDCPEDTHCDPQTGVCLPDDPDQPSIDVRGQWLTRYHIDISDALPGFFTNGMGPVVDDLDMLFRSQIEINVPIIGDILEGMIDALLAEFVPPWVPMVVSVAADFVHLFETMETEGMMTLYQSPETPILGPNIWGDEEWTNAQFFIASLCDGGVQQFQSDRSCGAVDVAMTPNFNVDYSNNDPTVGVQVEPFSGLVTGPTLNLNGRVVKIKIKQLINVLLDVVVAMASNGTWYDFEEFLVDIVPCLDIQYAIDDLACNISDGSFCQVPGIEALCEAAATLAVNALTNALGELGPTLTLTFDDWALIGESPPGYGSMLGNPLVPDDPTGSDINGGVDLIFNGDGQIKDDSWWYGTR